MHTRTHANATKRPRRGVTVLVASARRSPKTYTIMPASKGPTKPAKPAQRGDLKVLPLPEEFRTLLYLKAGRICARYTEIREYCQAYPYTIDLTSDDGPEQLELASTSENARIAININDETPVDQPRDSFDILPYITILFTFPEATFDITTANSTQGPLLSNLVSQIILNHQRAWKEYALDSGCVQEVKLWWRDKSVDFVLKPGSKWATEWDCDTGQDEGAEPREMRARLGLTGKKGAVVVGSVEVEEW